MPVLTRPALAPLARRAAVGAFVLVLALAGCGGQQVADNRGSIDFELVKILTETAVGGMISPGAVALADPAAVAQWNAQFTNQRMPETIAEFADDLAIPDGQAAYAAVVGIGCDLPSGVSVISTDSGILIEPVESTAEPVQCYAPMTMVAIVLVDTEAVAPAAG